MKKIKTLLYVVIIFIVTYVSVYYCLLTINDYNFRKDVEQTTSKKISKVSQITTQDFKDIKEKVQSKNDNELKEILEKNIEEDTQAITNTVNNLERVVNKDSDNKLKVNTYNKHEDFLEINTSTEVIAKLFIPSINLKLNVFEGLPEIGNEEEDTMLKGATTNLKNQKLGFGNYVLSSHFVDNSSDLLFSQLHNTKIGDLITIQDSNYEYSYIIYNKYVVNKSDTFILNETDVPTLTLYTCVLDENTHIYSNRTVVKAYLKDIKEL